MSEKIKAVPAPENPLLSEEGLSPQIQEENQSLRHSQEYNYKDADKTRKHQPNSATEMYAAPGWARGSERRARRAEKKATELFNQDEGTFAVQAVHDAEKAGVKTDFGTTEAEVNRLRKEAGYPGEDEPAQKREAA